MKRWKEATRSEKPRSTPDLEDIYQCFVKQNVNSEQQINGMSNECSIVYHIDAAGIEVALLSWCISGYFLLAVSPFEMALGRAEGVAAMPGVPQN